MVTSMAASVSRSMMSFRVPSSFSYLVSRRSISSASSIARSPPLPGFRFARSTTVLSRSLRVAVPGASRLNVVRCRSDRAGGPTYSPLKSNSDFTDRPRTEMPPLFLGCDYKHWLIVMEGFGEDTMSKQQKIKFYIETLANVVGSVEEATKKIYNVSCERHFGFGCELDEETADKLEGLPGILFVLPDSYVDAETQDYGAELLVDGEIVQRPPDKQRWVMPGPQIYPDRQKYSDRTYYTRRANENLRQ